MGTPASTGSMKTARAGSRPRRRLILACIGVSALVLAIGAAFMWRRTGGGGGAPPPVATATPVTLAKFVATPAFAQLPEAQKEPYLRSIQQNLHAVIAAGESGALSKEEQVAAVRNVMRSRARLEARTYAAIRDPKARKAHLDRLIEEQEVLRRHDKEGKSAPSLAQMKMFMESLPPEERVQMAGLVFDLVKRRAEHGLAAIPVPGMK